MVTSCRKIASIALVASTLLDQPESAKGLSSSFAFGIGKQGFKDFLSQKLPSDFSPVNEGGWSALNERYVSEVGSKNFHKFKATLPKDIDVVAAGGFDNLMKLAADPKAELVTLIKNNVQTSGKSDYKLEGSIDALVALLQSQGRGFNSISVDGEWVSVLSRQGKKSPKLQKILGKREKSKKAFSNFLVSSMEFENLSYTPRKNGVLKATVQYNPMAENFEIGPDGKIVLRRISAEISSVSFKYKNLPKVPLLPKIIRGGHLDFVYLDDDIRITKGNKGGLFVHFRPEFFEKTMS